VETYLFLHYMAPLVVVGILLSCLMIAGLVWRAAHALGGHSGQLHTSGGFGFRRAEVVRNILTHPGQHVVFVHFTAGQGRQRSRYRWSAAGLGA
jgi:hypothetical protein